MTARPASALRRTAGALAITVVAALAMVLGGASPAAARQPVFVDDRTPPGSAPVLEDGTVAFAVYGTVRGPERQASIQARFRVGDPLVVELLVPDLPPEATRADEDLPRLAIVSPSGATTELTVDRREPLGPPAVATSSLRIADARATAEEGVYVFTVTSRAPARFTLAIGEREAVGTVSGASAPAPGALDAWSSTPPPEVPEGPDDPVPATDADAAAVDDLDPARFAGGGADDSSPGRAAGLPLALGALIIFGVVVTAVVRSRRTRVPAQFQDGSGPQ